MEEDAPHFMPPSVDEPAILSGASYTYYSPIPSALLPPPPCPQSSSTGDPVGAAAGPACALGVDEAGRGPVLGPMVYGVFFLPVPLSDPLLRAPAHRFDDSKALTPAVREALVRALCAPGSDLARSCGYAVRALSARDIGAGMLRAAGAYNLNAQAMDATVDLIRGVIGRGVNVAEIYVDTVGSPAAYELKLQRLFPSARVTVAKKADSLYPTVSAASVCAKVTRDKALEVLWWGRPLAAEPGGAVVDMEWGSGYPSDGRCVGWLRSNMHPVFGWGPECRFSWGTAKDMLEPEAGGAKGAGAGALHVEWPDNDDGEAAGLKEYFAAAAMGREGRGMAELASWFGTAAGLGTF